MEIAVVIMAGGVGTRFWPLSTSKRPKQFLRLLGESSLLQESYNRALLLAPAERVFVLTNAAFVQMVLEQLPGIPSANVVGEPCRRDTAAAVALAALLLRERLGDPVMTVLTADHRISPPEDFRRAIAFAAEAAFREPGLYTFGIRPTHPATGYGYLQAGEELPAPSGRAAVEPGGATAAGLGASTALGGSRGSGPAAGGSPGAAPSAGGSPAVAPSADSAPAAPLVHRRLRRFKEKPDLETAQAFLDSGDFFWNSGMFVWRVSTILAELGRCLPGHLAALERAVSSEGTSGWSAALAAAFAELPPVSIDRGVMEKAADVRLLVAPFAWSDLGGWPAIEEFLPQDGQGNRHRGQMAALDARNNLVFSDDPEELVALVGVEDLAVVRAGKRTLVVPKARSEDVKALVQALEHERQGRHS
jgi:mannose-1-phosphate guanylyltransferase